jgi:hypothetical protein
MEAKAAIGAALSVSGDGRCARNGHNHERIGRAKHTASTLVAKDQVAANVAASNTKDSSGDQ